MPQVESHFKPIAMFVEAGALMCLLAETFTDWDKGLHVRYITS